MTTYQERVAELQRTKANGAMAVWLSSLVLGGPFAIAWLLDDGSANQPYPQWARQLVLIAAALHVGSVAYPLVKAAWAREPVRPIIGKLVSGYFVLAVVADIGWRLRGFGIFALMAYVLLAGPMFFALRQIAHALNPATKAPKDVGNPIR